ncbi:glycosyltransferase [Arvimicrobium flavum]|uniref:glycosyltransferase n=1 Tax=Arvimicrobium flavum TaxID=3393320 RepID=UPI00237B0946|nr:glycosyltransferase [Mesorhizobium shangrilense]
MNSISTLHVLYLVHDLSDPAVRRRVIMLQAGGAKVTLAGFRRSMHPATAQIDGLSPIDLGPTQDGRFAQRLLAIAKASLSLRAKLKGIAKPDVIIGRNLEMLALAKRARTLLSADIPVAYECLDIHRLLLGQNKVSRAMRGAERALGRDAALLMTSSPAFVRDYFQRLGQIDAPVMLLQNKVLDLSDSSADPRSQAIEASSHKPWTIGWFGALRCRKSLHLLAAFTRQMEGRYEVVLRGRPAYSEFPDFDAFVGSEPHLRFEGSYRNPEDLARIYGEVHFAWAIDFFEEGLNSSWLLPNRLYEGCRYGVVPIAMRQTETGRFLAARQMGILLDEASAWTLGARLGEMNAGSYAAARQKILAEDRGTWVSGLRDCRALVDRLKALAGSSSSDGAVRAA